MMDKIINLNIAVYFAAMFIYVLHLFLRRPGLGLSATICLWAGLGLNTAAVVIRWLQVGHPPFSNMYESTIFFAWSITLIYLILEVIYKIRLIGGFSALLALLALGYVSLIDSSARPLLPALQSNWLTIHVVVCFIGYGAFGISFICALVYLFLPGKNIASKKTTINIVDTLTYKTIAFGFPFLTLGIVTGAVWANEAWGGYWSWDPKETWSLITWFIYAVYLHLRLVRGWRGVRSAWVAIIGFAAVIFTYFGVNYLLSGLHSYA